ncbi:MAG: isoprenylcysteine carboxylmethyltransferase family protein [Alphaproteobacteria bacterium]|mgnify:CR=1 FL=1
MTVLLAVIALIALQRLSELAISARHTRQLRAKGAIEYGARHYPLLITLHAAWLASLLVFVPWDTAPHWWLLGVLALLQCGRVWVILSLGPYWTTRIITLPGATLVRRGPYRWMRHPNYAIVAGEIAVLPLAFGAWTIAILFSLLNAALLYHRIRVEDAALSARRANRQDPIAEVAARRGA